MQTTRWMIAALATALVLAALPGAAQGTPESKYDQHLLDRLATDPVGPHRLIVTTTGAPHASADAARLMGAEVTWTYGIIDGFAAIATTDTLAALAARADVAGIWLDRPVAPVMDVSHRAIEADKAWAAGYDGSGVTVAVIDTGIDKVHTFFPDAVVSCVSTIGGLTSPECTDTDGHGTHVAGTVASRDDQYPGVAPGASLAIVRVLHAAGAGTSADIIAGMDWVRTNKDRVSPPIRVATMSIGFVDPGCGDGSGPEAAAANALVDAGVPFTVAAGNSGHKSCTIDGASAAAKVTTIAAVDDKGTITQGDDVIASFSSGGSSKNDKPDLALPGVGITSAFLGGGTLVATLDGTSMATPHAAGILALLFDKDPGMSAAAAKTRLTGTAVKTQSTGSTFNFVYGHGLGNACRALQLNGCATIAEPEPPTDVRVSSVTPSVSHGNGKNPPHVLTTSVKIVSSTGAAVAGASVSIETTSPEGDRYTASGTTGADGIATMSVSQRGGGHGTWQSCVTAVTGSNMRYVPASNTETCDTAVAAAH